jgi:hypothetical protein
MAYIYLIQTPELHTADTKTYTWNRLHSDCCELSGRVATAAKGRGRRDSGARFGRCSHRHDIIRGGKSRSGVRAKVEVLIRWKTNVETRRAKTWRNRGAGEWNVWLIKVACRPKFGRSEDWLVSAAALDPQQEKGGRRSTAMQAMQM